MDKTEISGVEYSICIQTGDNGMLIGQVPIYKNGYTFYIFTGTFPADYKESERMKLAYDKLYSMIGYMTPKYRAFGMTAARLDDVLNLIPARLSWLFFVLAATITPGAHPFKALKIMLRDSDKHRSMNAGWPEGAAAGALDIALAGPRRYQKSITEDPWLGDGTARTGVKDIRKMLYLYVTAALINGAWVSALAIIRLS